jgi:hypothetical protein
MKPLTFKRRDDSTVVIRPEEVPGLAATIRSWNRESRPPRDLAAEIVSYLATNPGASVPEIARAIRARDHDVRSNLQGDERFRIVSPKPGRSSRVIGWAIAPDRSQPVPVDGTSGSESGGEVS